MSSTVDVTYADSFLNLPQEQLVIAKRQHSITIIPQIILVILLSFTLQISSYLLMLYWSVTTLVLTVTTLLIVSLTMSIINQIILDWYYHLYIVTTRKILEIHCRPLFSDNIDDVFLDQVRTTEVDVQVNNTLYELLDVGSVSISFDRPSHDKLFIISSISCPREVGRVLAQALEVTMSSSPVWFKRDRTNQTLHTAEDIIEPNRLLEGTAG